MPTGAGRKWLAGPPARWDDPPGGDRRDRHRSQVARVRAGPEVRTAAGVLRGSREAGLAVFRGVPYAEPPVGALRFAAPRPVRGWAGVRAALSYGPPPPQAGLFGMGGLAQETAGGDWLSVNVWSPDPAPGGGLPVLVWIPGGGYVIGTSSLPEFDGGRLAGGGAVVVTPTTGWAWRVSRRSAARPPTGACSTRSPRCSGCATTSGPSAATRPG